MTPSDGRKLSDLQSNFEASRDAMGLPDMVKNVWGSGTETFYQEINPTLNTDMRLNGINALLSQIGYKVVSYLNTPHYCTEEDFSYHKEWEKILQFYDEGYSDDNEPFQLFDLEKALALSEGVEPVVYFCKNILDEKSKRKILSTLKWENGSWKMKKGFFFKLKIK